MDESCYINESVLLNYFAGELPADRRKEVEEWIAASEDNEKMARDIFRLYRAADTLDYMNRVDASAALQQVKGRIHNIDIESPGWFGGSVLLLVWRYRCLPPPFI